MTIGCKICNKIQNVHINTTQNTNVPYILTYAEHYTTDSLYINMQTLKGL